MKNVSKNYTKGFTSEQVTQITLFEFLFKSYTIEDCEYMIDQYKQLVDSEQEVSFIEWMQGFSDVQKQIVSQNNEVSKMFKNQVNK